MNSEKDALELLKISVTLRMQIRIVQSMILQGAFPVSFGLQALGFVSATEKIPREMCISFALKEWSRSPDMEKEIQNSIIKGYLDYAVIKFRQQGKI
jgi:hypothetical protein